VPNPKVKGFEATAIVKSEETHDMWINVTVAARTKTLASAYLKTCVDRLSHTTVFVDRAEDRLIDIRRTDPTKTVHHMRPRKCEYEVPLQSDDVIVGRAVVKDGVPKFREE